MATLPLPALPRPCSGKEIARRDRLGGARPARHGRQGRLRTAAPREACQRGAEGGLFKGRPGNSQQLFGPLGLSRCAASAIEISLKLVSDTLVWSSSPNNIVAGKQVARLQHSSSASGLFQSLGKWSLADWKRRYGPTESLLRMTALITTRHVRQNLFRGIFFFLFPLVFPRFVQDFGRESRPRGAAREEGISFGMVRTALGYCPEMQKKVKISTKPRGPSGAAKQLARRSGGGALEA